MIISLQRMIKLKTEVMEQKIQTMYSVWGRIYIGTDYGDVIAKSIQVCFI